MKFFVAVLILNIFTHVLTDEKVRYDGFQVHRITPKTSDAANSLKILELSASGYDFWTPVKGVNHPVDVMVPPHLKYRFRDLLKTANFDSQVYINNVQELVDNEKSKIKSNGGDFGWTDYHTLDEINAWLKGLAANDSRVTLINGGKTYEGRNILGVHVSFAPGNENRSVFIEANIHAREWISSAVATYILNQFLTSDDPNIRQVADSRDWYFIPVFNPDGFEYTHTTDRMWRKTRVVYELCYGADPNRNWGYHFNEGGSSNFPCAETFSGPKAFSEPSTKSLSEFITSVGPSLQGYFALHSYSQLMLIPYGYTGEHLDNYQDLYEIGIKGAHSVAQRYGTEFSVGNMKELMYIASGASVDWVKGTFNTPITYTFELRDKGHYGFILPADQITPSCEEILDGFITIFQEFDKILPKK